MYKKVFVFIFSGILSLGLIIYIVILFVPENPIKIRYSNFNNKEILRLFPQGWSFFTKNPRGYTYKLYRIIPNAGNSNSVDYVSMVNSQASQYYGINREIRLTSAKLMQIATSIEDEAWYNYRGNTKLLLNNPESISTINLVSMKIESRILRGLYCLEYTKPIPWSYANLKKDFHMPSKLVLINFK